MKLGNFLYTWQSRKFLWSRNWCKFLHVIIQKYKKLAKFTRLYSRHLQHFVTKLCGFPNLKMLFPDDGSCFYCLHQFTEDWNFQLRGLFIWIILLCIGYPQVMIVIGLISTKRLVLKLAIMLVSVWQVWSVHACSTDIRLVWCNSINTWWLAYCWNQSSEQVFPVYSSEQKHCSLL